MDDSVPSAADAAAKLSRQSSQASSERPPNASAVRVARRRAGSGAKGRATVIGRAPDTPGGGMKDASDDR
eukprot:gene26659-67253_t